MDVEIYSISMFVPLKEKYFQFVFIPVDVDTKQNVIDREGNLQKRWQRARWKNVTKKTLSIFSKRKKNFQRNLERYNPTVYISQYKIQGLMTKWQNKLKKGLIGTQKFLEKTHNLIYLEIENICAYLIESAILVFLLQIL